ncbi:MAG TPA: hypothetical protein VGM80_16020 [Gaiellaceae bacterium]
MDTYHYVLYIHLLSLFVGVGAAAVLSVCLFQLRGAKELTDALPWGRVAGKTGRMFPIAILGLFGSGAYLTSDVWTWSTGWIQVGIAALVVLGLQGPLIAERSGKKLEHALKENGPGPLGEHARRMARHPGMWVVEFSAIGLVLAIVWNMTTKASMGSAIAAAVIGYGFGAALGWFFSRAPSAEPEAVVSPSGP